MRPIIYILFTFILLLPLHGFSQVGAPATTPPASELSEPIPHLEPLSNSAARNMLYQILGKVAQAAAGDLGIEAIAGTNALSLDEVNAEGIFALLMNYMNIAILAGLGLLMFVTVNLMILQSTIEGQLVSKRYGAWSAVRIGMAILTIMPVLGGWSVGQYGVIKVVVFGSDTADMMTAQASRFLLQGGSIRPIATDTTKIRAVVRTVYNNELCTALTNFTLEQKIGAETRQVSEVIEKTEIGLFSSIASFFATSGAEQRIVNRGTERIEYQRIENDGVADSKTYTHAWKNLASPTTPLCGSALIKLDDFYEQLLGSTNDYREGAVSGVIANLPEPIKNAMNNMFLGHQAALASTVKEAKVQVNDALIIIRDIYAAGYSSATDENENGIIDALEIMNARKSAFISQLDTITQSPYAAFIVHSLDILRMISSDAEDGISKASDKLRNAAVISYATTIEEGVSNYATILGNTFTTARLTYAATLDRQQANFNVTQNAAAESGVASFEQIKSVSPSRGASGGYDTYSTELARPETTLFTKTPDSSDYGVKMLLDSSSKGWLFLGYRWFDLSRSSQYLTELGLVYPKVYDFNAFIGMHSNQEVKANLAVMRDKLAFVAQASIVGSEIMNKTISEAVINANGDKELKSIRNSDVNSQDYIFALAEANADDFENFQQTYFNGIRSQVDTNLWNINFQTSDILMELQELGHFFMSTAALLQSAKLVVQGASYFGAGKILSAANSVKNFVTGGERKNKNGLGAKFAEGLAGLLDKAIFFCFLAGFILAVYLPMLPAIHWTFAIIGWIQNVFEILIAMPLWGAAHAVPEGDGIVGQHAANGWKILVVIAAMPMVLVISMFAALLMLSSLGYILQEVYHSFIPSTTLEFSNGIDLTNVIGGGVATLLMYLMFIVFMVASAHRVFAWLSEVGEKMGTYIGGGAQQLGAQQGNAGTQAAFASVQTQATQQMKGGNPNTGKPGGGAANMAKGG
ncbi:MAG: conjugal transfer/type IV secretion protein DotA/TraY [Oleiphilaceae bacterium]|jgi:conjugal transfer/type IV secretion protein DotA/TraY